jgi:hypothetical protein
MTFVCSPTQRFLFDESVKAAHGVVARANPALARNDLAFALKRNRTAFGDVRSGSAQE